LTYTKRIKQQKIPMNPEIKQFSAVRVGNNYSAAKPSHVQAVASLPGGGGGGQNINHSISWVSPGYKVRSHRNPVEPESRGGVHRMPLLLRERRRRLAC
jgi:hypothetical protein